MKIKGLLLLLLLNTSFVYAQQFTKESLEARMKESLIFGDSLKIPVYSSEVWGFKDEGFHFINKEGKWGLKNANKNKLIIPYEIDSVLVQYNAPNIKSYSIKRSGTWESYTFTKKYKMKKANPYSGLALSNSMNDIYKGKDYLRFDVIYNGKRGIKNCNFETIVPLRYDYVLEMFDALSESNKDTLSYLLYNNNKVGMHTNKGTIEPKYDDIGAFEFRGYDYVAIIKLDYEKDYFGTTINGKVGIMNYKEEILVPHVYDKIIYCKPYLQNATYPDKFVVFKERKQGVVNITGELLLPIEYDTIEFDETFEKLDHFIVSKKGKYGVVNSLNEVIKPIKFSRTELDDD
nr:WG repeat-containing protein [uncultured Psychroserpens sp.]